MQAASQDYAICIISWSGKHVSAQRIWESLAQQEIEACIVYSDPADDAVFPPHVRTLRRDNRLFWSDKFQACMAHAGDRGLLILHADCQCDDWSRLIRRGLNVMRENRKIAVWSPHVEEGAHFPIEKTSLAKIDNSTLSVVSRVDALVFALSPQVVARMRAADYTGNLYGLGIGWMFCAFAHATNHLVVIDESCKVHHALSRGYDISLALEQQHQFLKQLTADELIHFILIRAYTYANRPPLSAAPSSSQ